MPRRGSSAPGQAQALPCGRRGPATEVHLDGPADLQHLRETNFNHYLRARKILAAANEICRPGPLKTYLTQFSDADPHCDFMVLTSFPPKKVLSFRLDTVHYMALITLSNIGAKQ